MACVIIPSHFAVIDSKQTWCWQRDSPSFFARLGVLQRRSSGDWISDLEENVIIN